MTDWHVFQGSGEQHDWVTPPTPPWRFFDGGPLVETADATQPRPADLERARAYQAAPDEIQLVNVALYLRRPLLITGKPGTGKSTLAYAIAHELNLGAVLRWPITSRSTLADGLYRYDAIGRLQDANLATRSDLPPPSIGRYVRLGPLGTALLPSTSPRVLLIDEIDKSDIDLPNDLLNVFEEGEFAIPELARLADTEAEVEVQVEHGDRPVPVRDGRVRCREFPIVIMTSNGERDFPPAFLRRCVRLDLAEPDEQRLARIVEAHLGAPTRERATDLISHFLERRRAGDLATDQLLNAIFLISNTAASGGNRDQLAEVVLRHINAT